MLLGGLGLIPHIPDIEPPRRPRGIPDNVAEAGRFKIWPRLHKQPSNIMVWRAAQREAAL